jgi:hypothetical protein
MSLLRTAWVAGFVLCSAPAWATPPAQRAVRAIEKSMQVLAKHPESGDVFVPALEGAKSHIVLRPNAKAIIVESHGFFPTQHGFFPDAKGHLSPEKREELARQIDPGVDEHAVFRTVRASIQRQTSEVARAVRASSKIDGLLADAGKLPEGQVLFTRGRVSVRVHGDALLIEKKLSLFGPKELPLEKGADGKLTLSPRDREELGLVLVPRD